MEGGRNRTGAGGPLNQPAWDLEAGKTQEQVVHAEEETTREGAILRDLGGIVWESDSPERRLCSFVSGRPQEILGYPAERWTTEVDFWRQLILEEEREATCLFFRESAARRERHELEYPVRAADGRTVWLRDVVRVVPRNAGGSETRLRGVMVDVTERHELQGLLLQSQKMEAVGRLAGGIAHDFNNLLTVITGYANLLLGRAADERTASELSEIRDAAERAASLTSQLLTFSRRGRLSVEIVDLNLLVSRMETMLRRLIDEDVTLTLRLAPELHRIRVDPGQLEQVVVNLVVNARDATPEGGTICVETASVDLGEYEARGRGLRAGAYVSLTVSDTGVGMSKQTSARIFEPFYTTRPQGQGTGLGLATVHGIVDQAGGGIEVRSEIETGTDMVVYFPEAPSTERPESIARGPTVLLVEDEDSLRRLARLILEREHYHVIEARNGLEAIELSNRQDGTIALLLTDVVMPRLGGRELAKQLKRLRPEIKLLFMSGYNDSHLARQGVVEEDVAFVRKPFTPETLSQRVRETLATTNAEPSGSRPVAWCSWAPGGAGP